MQICSARTLKPLMVRCSPRTNAGREFSDDYGGEPRTTHHVFRTLPSPRRRKTSRTEEHQNGDTRQTASASRVVRGSAALWPVPPHEGWCAAEHLTMRDGGVLHERWAGSLMPVLF